MIEPIGLLTVIGLILYLLVGIFQWWTKRNDAKQKAKDDLKKQIDDSVKSGDVSRINATIQQLRR